MQVMEHAFDELDGPIVRVCSKNLPVPYSKPLEDYVIPGNEELRAGIRRALIGSGLDLK